MALPIRDQLKYWGIAAAVFMVALWFMGDVLLPFLLGGAIAYFLDPVADRLERLGLYCFSNEYLPISKSQRALALRLFQ